MKPVSIVLLILICLPTLGCNYPAAPAPTVPGTILPPTETPFQPVLDSPTAPPPSITPMPTETPVPTPVPTLSYTPVFEPASCAFPVPEGTSPECGYLVVPENRSNLSTGFIRLHVAVFRTWSSQPAPDPVVHLAGGPGSSSLGVAGYLFQVGLGSILSERDFILFDQRGTGYSQPRLDCPERQSLAPVLLEGHLPPGEQTQAIRDALLACRDRLASAGIDLSAYNSAASAADLNDLRLALGYDRLNLYAVSYGTRLALTLMRDFPHAVRSAVLDSVYPPEVHLYTALAPNAGRAFDVFFARCAADPGCSANYPGLEESFYALVDQLNDSPVTVDLYATGSWRSIRLDGRLLVDVLFVGLYNPYVTASMPEMIAGIQNGEYGILRERLSLYFDDSGAIGMQTAVQCREEIPFSPPEEAYTAAEGLRPQIAGFFPESVQPLFAICQDWGIPLADLLENQPVVSNVSALVLAGEGDPITPPEWGRQAAANLSQGYFYEFAGHGHWVTRSSDCALEMALAFWEDPTQPPAAGCLD